MGVKWRGGGGCLPALTPYDFSIRQREKLMIDGIVFKFHV